MDDVGSPNRTARFPLTSLDCPLCCNFLFNTPYGIHVPSPPHPGSAWTEPLTRWTVVYGCDAGHLMAHLCYTPSYGIPSSRTLYGAPAHHLAPTASRFSSRKSPPHPEAWVGPSIGYLHNLQHSTFGFFLQKRRQEYMANARNPSIAVGKISKSRSRPLWVRCVCLKKQVACKSRLPFVTFAEYRYIHPYLFGSRFFES